MGVIKITLLALTLIAVYYFIKYLVDSSAAKSLKTLRLNEYSSNNALSENELRVRKREVKSRLKQIEREYSQTKINHILHLILSVITVGFWILIWLVIANNVGFKRAGMEKLIDESYLTLDSIEEALDDLG